MHNKQNVIVFNGADKSRLKDVLRKLVPGFLDSTKMERWWLLFAHQLPFRTYMKNLKLISSLFCREDHFLWYSFNILVLFTIKRGKLSIPILLLRFRVENRMRRRGEKLIAENRQVPSLDIFNRFNLSRNNLIWVLGRNIV